MISPIALRRTISRLSNRGLPVARDSVIFCVFGVRIAIRTASRFSRLQPRASTAVDDRSGRMILGIANDDHAASAGFDLVPLGDALHRVVGALSLIIRTNFANNRANVLFEKDYDSVHVRQRSQNFRALFGRHHRTPFAFTRAYGGVGVTAKNNFPPKE